MNVYTDGSCKKNRRVKDTTKQPKGGIGIFWDDDCPFNTSESFKIYPVTNQRTELYACIKAIDIYCENFSINNELTIYTDSLYVINCMTDWIKRWKHNNWKTATGKNVKNQDLIIKLDEIIVDCDSKIRFKHVRAHQTEPMNEDSDEYKHWYGNMMADKLASDY